MSDKHTELEESSVTANANGDPMPKIDNTVPGQTGSGEDLGSTHKTITRYGGNSW